jgi:hypothetical protein
MKCVLCGGDIDAQRDSGGEIVWAGGHNAQPLAEGRCCSLCNDTKVVPKRMRQVFNVEDK